jgi:hypothetical protein
LEEELKSFESEVYTPKYLKDRKVYEAEFPDLND